MPVSPRTLLRLLQTGPVPEPEMPRVVGIDDFAWKKGRQYGTILVDLEQRQVVDLLPDRSADSVAAWLSCRPHVDLVCRDRSGLYADGARRGAPQAQQVADRFHLLTNLVDTLEELLLHQRGLLKEAAAATLEALAPPVVSPPDEMYRGRRKCPQNWQRRTEETSRLRHVTRLAQYEAICALRAKGMRLTDIAQQVGVSRQTVDRYLRLSGPPERKQPIPTRRRVLEPFEPYLLERWQEGCHNGVQLWREIRARGYPASVANVARFVRRLRQEGLPRKVGSSSLASRRGPSARQVAFLLVRCPLERTNEQRLYLEHLTQRDATIATASTLTERFAQMVRERQGAELDRWIAQATQSGIAALQRFAQGLQSDYAAVKAGLTEIWSNGQTEGQINRLKLLKRQSYGRAGFALLRQRVLSAA
jgi:transposase